MFKKAILTLMAIFMASSGMPVYAEQANEPEVTEQKDDAQASAKVESVLEIKKLYAEEPSTLTTGEKFNEAIKTLAAGKSKAYNATDSFIRSIQVVNTPPFDSTTIKDVSTNNDRSCLAWWDEETGTIKLYLGSEPEKNLNPEAIKALAAEMHIDYDNDEDLGKYIQVVDTLPDSPSTKDVSANNDGSYLAWWDEETSTIKLYSESGDVILNSDSDYMFFNCDNLATLDVSKWDTSQVTNMQSMFANCISLTTIDFGSNWNTSKVTNMSDMFSGCINLTTLDVSKLDTSKVTSMDAMFYRCWNLKTLDVSGLDTSQVTNMKCMFFGCNSLTTMDLSGWDTSQVMDMSSMFESCSHLTTIYIGEGWNTDKAANSSNMFRGCSKLPHFNSSIVDKTNANAGPLGYMSKRPLHYLPDTVFVLSGTSDYGTPVNMVVTSNKNGRMSLKNIEKGTYTLTEVSPTDGYIKNSVKYTVTVTDSGASVTPDNADYYYETADQKVLFNEPYHAFTIQKASSTDSTIGVAGAEFLLSGVSDYGTEVSQAQTTGSTGIATFDHLEAGNYLLTETKAPEHYALDPISRVVSINKYGTVKIDGLSKEGSSFVWTDIRNADGTVTITKKWNDTLTGTNAAGRTLPSIVISTQRTIPDAVTVTYYAGDGYFGTDQNNKINRVTYSEVVDLNGNVLSAFVSKGQEMTPSLSGKVFDALYLDSAFTKKAPDSIADYIKANPNVHEVNLYAKYKDASTLATGQKFNEAIKTLAAGESKGYTDDDALIQSVQVVNTRPSDGVTTKDVSANNDGSYLVWWDAGTHTIKLYSESGDVILNPDSRHMFFNCTELTTMGVSGWDTSKVTNMSGMFTGCNNLKSLDVSKWNTDMVTNMFGMFQNCSSLTTLDLSGWDTSQVTSMVNIFQNCSSLTTLDVSKWDTSKVTNMSGTFNGCNELTTLDVSKWDTSHVTNMGYMFTGCKKLTALDVSKWDTDMVTNMFGMFQNCSSLTTLDVSKWNTSQVTSMYGMFEACSSLATLDVSGWNTSNVTNMSYMFSKCSKLTSLDVSKWNTSRVTRMDLMFSKCSKLTPLDVSKWNTSRVTRMDLMFSNCGSLTTLDVSNWDTSSATNMSFMFYGCKNLTTLNVSGFDTSQVTNMSNMFYNCSNLTTLDVSKWNTGSVTNMSCMFQWCRALFALDVSKWDTSQVTDMHYMFSNCTNLTTIYIGSGWNTDNVTSSDDMFDNCTKLSNFNSSVVDKTNAHAGSGGYMTLK